MIITVQYITEDGKVHQSAEDAVNHGTALDICNRLGLDIDDATLEALVAEMLERDAVLEQLRAHEASFKQAFPEQPEDATSDPTQP